MPTQSIDDYLKAIFELTERQGKAATSAIARRLDVTPASVTGMLRRLAGERPPFVKYEKHRGAVLTRAGRTRALEVLRHHRLLERFLHDALGYSWDEVHSEAEQLEHAISEQFEDRIAEHLGDPETDPHGHPIPRKDGTIPIVETVSLLELEPGRDAEIALVSDDDPKLLRHLAALGLVPGVRFTLVSADPFEGPLTLALLVGGPVTLSRRAAEEIRVRVA